MKKLLSVVKKLLPVVLVVLACIAFDGLHNSDSSYGSMSPDWGIVFSWLVFFFFSCLGLLVILVKWLWP